MTLVVLGAKRLPAQSDGFVLLESPDAEWIASTLGSAQGGTIGHASWEGDARSRFAALCKAAEKNPNVVCVASSDGSGMSPSGAAGRRLLVQRVLPALARHFESVGTDDSDPSPWLLTHVLGALIQFEPSAEALEAALTAIDASLGRGDATSTRQNLGAAANLLYYARRANPTVVVEPRPLLEALLRLSDARRWPADPTTLSAGLEAASPRYAMAIVQITTRVANDHGRTPEALCAILAAAAAAPGAREVLSRPEPPLELDLRRAVHKWLAELRRTGVHEQKLEPVEQALRYIDVRVQ